MIHMLEPKDLDAAEQVWRDATWLAIDTEFHAERRYIPQLHLVQVHVPGGDVWLLDPHIEGLLTAAGPALRARPWLVHAGDRDLQLLNVALGGVSDRVFDTQIAAGLLHRSYPAGLATISERLLGERPEKTATLSDWKRRPLSAAQVDYAAEDVRLLPRLHTHLVSALRSHGRTELAERACADARARAITPMDPSRAWERLNAAAWLSGPALLVLQELCAWRETEARAGDQPTHSIVADRVLIELAKRQPRTVVALADNRRMPRNVHKKYGATLVDRINDALGRPDSAIPRHIHRYSDTWITMLWLETFAETLGRDQSFGARLVLPEARRRRIVLDPPADRAALTEQLGWTDDLVGDALWEALQGTAALTAPKGHISWMPLT